MGDAPRSGALTIGIVAGEASGDALGAILISAVQRARPAARASSALRVRRCRRRAASRGTRWKRWRCGGIVEVVARLPELVGIRRALARRLLAERVPHVHRCRRARFQSRARAQAEARRRAHRALRRARRYGRGGASASRRSAARSHRMLALFPFEPPIYEAAGVPVTFVGHPLAQDAATLASRARGARAAEARHRAAGVRAAAREPHASELEQHGDLVLQTAAALHAARPDALFPRAARDEAHARAIRGGALPARPRASCR